MPEDHVMSFHSLNVTDKLHFSNPSVATPFYSYNLLLCLNLFHHKSDHKHNMNPVRNIVRSGHLLSAARPALRSPALPVLAVATRRGYHEKDMFDLFLKLMMVLRKLLTNSNC
jgi:hypothetical protein